MKTMKLCWYWLLSLLPGPVSLFCLIGLTTILVSTMGCGGVATVAGDSYSVAVKNEGRPTWARTVDDEKWCEWFIDDRIAGGPWAVVAFDLKDWEDWKTAMAVRNVTITRANGEVEKIEVKPVEPRAKWVRYNLRAMDSMLPRP